MLNGDSTAYTDAGLQAILREDLGYLRCEDDYTPETTLSIRSLDRCSWTTREGYQEEYHPYSFAANLGINGEDNPTYNDVLTERPTERVL